MKCAVACLWKYFTHFFSFTVPQTNRFSSHFQMHNYLAIFQQFQTSSHRNEYFIYYTMLVIYNIFIKLFHQFYDKIFLFLPLFIFSHLVLSSNVLMRWWFFSIFLLHHNSNIIWLSHWVHKSGAENLSYFHNISYGISFFT